MLGVSSCRCFLVLGARARGTRLVKLAVRLGCFLLFLVYSFVIVCSFASDFLSPSTKNYYESFTVLSKNDLGDVTTIVLGDE